MSSNALGIGIPALVARRSEQPATRRTRPRRYTRTAVAQRSRGD